MIKQHLDKELEVKFTGTWNNEPPKSDKVIDVLLATGLWQLMYTHTCMRTDRYITIHSHMNGYDNGRYWIKIRPLKSKYQGHTHHVIIYWPPYNMRDCKWIGYVNSGEELLEAVRQVNPELLNPQRMYESVKARIAQLQSEPNEV